MIQYNVNKYHTWNVYSCSIYILYSMYNNNNNNDNKYGAIVYTICAYVYTVRHLCQPTRTDRLAGQSKRGQCGVHIHHATHSTS